MKPVAQIGFIVALLYSIVGAPQGFAQTRALKKINWGVTSLSASNWIPWVAKDAKILRKKRSGRRVDSSQRLGADLHRDSWRKSLRRARWLCRP